MKTCWSLWLWAALNLDGAYWWSAKELGLCLGVSAPGPESVDAEKGDFVMPTSESALQPPWSWAAALTSTLSKPQNWLWLLHLPSSSYNILLSRKHAAERILGSAPPTNLAHFPPHGHSPILENPTLIHISLTLYSFSIRSKAPAQVGLGWEVRACTIVIPAENPSSIPSTHTGWLLTALSCCGLCRYLCSHAHRDTHSYTQN